MRLTNCFIFSAIQLWRNRKRPCFKAMKVVFKFYGFFPFIHVYVNRVGETYRIKAVIDRDNDYIVLYSIKEVYRVYSRPDKRFELGALRKKKPSSS